MGRGLGNGRDVGMGKAVLVYGQDSMYSFARQCALDKNRARLLVMGNDRSAEGIIGWLEIKFGHSFSTIGLQG
jgi:hypothetical protein